MAFLPNGNRVFMLFLLVLFFEPTKKRNPESIFSTIYDRMEADERGDISREKQHECATAGSARKTA